MFVQHRRLLLLILVLVESRLLVQTDYLTLLILVNRGEIQFYQKHQLFSGKLPHLVYVLECKKVHGDVQHKLLRCLIKVFDVDRAFLSSSSSMAELPNWNFNHKLCTLSWRCITVKPTMMFFRHNLITD